MSTIRFSVIIPFKRGKHNAKTLLAAVQSCQQQKGFSGSLEIFVVNNLEDPITKKELGEQKNLKVITAGGLGVNKARNTGARHASGDFLFFLDDDCCLPRESFLAELEQLLRQSPTFHAAGGAYQTANGASWKIQGYNSMASAWVRAAAEKKNNGAGLVAAQNLLGGNICYKKEIFDKGFFFHEEILIYGDETEFNRRLQAAGFLLGYSPVLDIFHNPEGSWQMLIKRAWKQGAAHGRDKKGSLVSDRKFKKRSLSAMSREPAFILFSCVHFPLLYLSSALSAAKEN